MRLTSLEVKGFKSFADKTTIHFNDNMTGIVGPNGCGKSNVVDAIRWVIGEQKARTLRSGKMEDLIFNGSKGRNASNLAEVALTFENTKNQLGTEFSTIRISRMYFRNGESEYRINDVPCRLKDINNLFMDTGVSSDSYAIIELKMIEEIISDRENSRRQLFEQAAGISKYKERKRETISKLESTQTDLNRVEDLLFEIEGNLKSLESQAKKAKKYYELKEEYKKESVDLAAFTLVNYKDEFENITKKQEEESDRKLQVETELNQIQAAVEKDKVVLIDKERRLNETQKNFNEFLNNITQQENDKKLAQEKIKFLLEKQTNLKQQIENSKTTIATLQSDIENAGNRKEDILKDLENAESKLTTAKEALENVKLAYEEKRKQLADEQLKKQVVDKHYYDNEKEIAVGDAQRNSHIAEINQSALWIASSKEQKESLQKQSEHLIKEKEEIEIAFKAAEEQELQLQNNIRSSRELLDQLRQELAVQNRQLDAKQNEYNLTKSMVDKLEGFPDSIKFLKQQPNFPKSAPLLSDIIAAKDEYKATIENLLEPYLNYYVVETLAEAVTAVNLLSDNKKGKANFFILEELKAYENIDAETIAHCTHALSIIESDAKYQSLINYLLCKVYITDDVENAPVSSRPDFTFISPNAKFIRSRFALSGGSVGLFEGKRLGRLKNLEKLQDEIAKLKISADGIDVKIKENQTQLVSMNQQLQNVNLNAQRNKLNQKTNEMIAVKTKLENVELQSKSNEERQTAIAEKIKLIEEKQKGWLGKLEELRIERDAFQSKIDELAVAYNDANNLLQQQTNEFNQTNIHFIQQQNSLKTIEQEIHIKQNQITQINQQYEQNQQALGIAEVDYYDLNKNLEVVEIQLSNLIGKREGLENELKTIEEEYYKSRTTIDELDNKLKSLQRTKEQVDAIIQSIKDKNTDLRLQLSGLKERLSIEFNINIDDIIDNGPNPDLNYEELQLSVSKAKERLEKFGEINPMAVEAFEEMKTRYDFIVAQKTDLVSAKTSLEETMKEIETTASEKFLDAFTKVKANFISVFQKLFTEGDQCDLYLENPDDVLESKIEVVAKPKGKKPSTITQLSGGEKTLTAIALLFSLYLLKPAPFCILDEVDAPLDDNNVGKFNNMIREFSNNSQFIIVTHNKATMASVDVIYGVTMAEPGVSRMVPVDFRSLE
ncbi:MAG: chromosome segregation protein [Bacteroidota bacterium]|jgi:chromosome segregation protein